MAQSWPAFGVHCSTRAWIGLAYELKNGWPHPPGLWNIITMSESDTIITAKPVSVEEIQRGWRDLGLRVQQLELERDGLEQESKALRSLLERVIEHRQKSHSELINLLSGLVTKLAINDVGVVVAKLVEHNAHVAEVSAALAKGKMEAAMIQPAVLRVLDDTKRKLVAALEPTVEELIKLETPFQTALLRSFVNNPESFFEPSAVRAARGFVKGQLPRERVVREFGEEALVLFQDVTTDPKNNPRPKAEDIMLVFPPDFAGVLKQHAGVVPDKHKELQTLQERVARSRDGSEAARAQKTAFMRLCFILELLHYYENQNTEAPDVVFAQRLPPIIEQIAVPQGQDVPDEKMLKHAESLLEFVINPDHRYSVISNTGKAGGLAKTIRYLMRFRSEKDPSQSPRILNELMPEFVRHLVTPPPKTETQQRAIAAALRFIDPLLQKLTARGLAVSDKLGKAEGEALSKLLAKELGLGSLEEAPKAAAAIPPEMERQLAWDKVKTLINDRADPTAIATAIRDRLHAKYDSDEVKHSWVLLTEADPMSLVRVFSQFPYRPDGKTDPIGKPVLEAYVVRLTHEKYAPTYNKVLNSLRNMFKVKPDSPALVNFVSLAKWADADCGAKIAADIGMH